MAAAKPMKTGTPKGTVIAIACSTDPVTTGVCPADGLEVASSHG